MIDKKWMWVARDKNGGVYVFSSRPVVSDDRPVWRCEAGDFVRCDSLFSDQGDWKDSLHEIIHHEDGKIEFRKALPELKVDDPVLVLTDTGSWLTRHFAGWSSDGDIITWEEGRTSFTSYVNKGFGSREVWREYKLP